MRLFVQVSVTICMSFLVGCATGPGTILRTNISFDSKETTTGITTGARQRLISSHDPGVFSDLGYVDPQRIVCVEPSPDVAIAIANSFGSGISVLGYGSGSVSGSTAEGVAQLAERTVAIQALLKQGYQACLDYANGAITRTTYSQRTAKLDDLLVTLVLGEVAGGAFGRSGAAIGGKSSADVSAQVSGLGAIGASLEGARKRLEEAELAVAGKEQELAAERAKLGTQQTDEEKQATEAKIKSLEAELATEKAKRNVALQQLKVTTDTVSKTAAEITTVVGTGALSITPNGEVAKVLNEMQARFLEKDIDHTFVSTCLTEMGASNASSDPNVPGRSQIQAVVNKAMDEIVTLGAQGVDNKNIYLATQFQRRLTPSRLLDFCENNLATFLKTSHVSRHELKLKQLDNESKRLDVLAKQGPSPISVKPVHPSTALSKLERDEKQLKQRQTQLQNATVSSSFPELVARKTTLQTDIQTLLKKTTDALSEAGRKNVKLIEDEYLEIVSSAGLHNAAAERKIWEQRLALQQAHAEQKAGELSTLAEGARRLAARVASLIDEIKAKE